MIHLIGWRVVSVSGSGESGVVTLVSAGFPVNGYLESGSNSAFVSAMRTFIQKEFNDNNFADYSDAMTKTEVSDWVSSNKLYECANRNRVQSFFTCSLAGNGVMGSGGSALYAGVYGVRPKVILKPGIKTNSSKDTSFLGNNCWVLKW